MSIVFILTFILLLLLLLFVLLVDQGDHLSSEELHTSFKLFIGRLVHFSFEHFVDEVVELLGGNSFISIHINSLHPEMQLFVADFLVVVHEDKHIPELFAVYFGILVHVELLPHQLCDLLYVFNTQVWFRFLPRINKKLLLLFIVIFVRRIFVNLLNIDVILPRAIWVLILALVARPLVRMLLFNLLHLFL